MGILDIFKSKKTEDEFAMPSDFMPRRGPPMSAVSRLDQSQMMPVPGSPIGMPPAPAPPAEYREAFEFGARPEAKPLLTEDIQAIAETIVAEKWKLLTHEFADMNKWRANTEKQVMDMKNKIDEIELKIDDLEDALLEKIDQYSKGVTDISAEIKAIQKVFRATLPEFTSRVKQLSVLTDKIQAKTIRKKISKKKRATKRKKRR